MLIKAVTIEAATAIKIYEKHSVLSQEVERVLTEQATIFKRVAGSQYAAVGLADRYLTIFFRYDDRTKEATITTAYPSSRKQVRFYKRMSR